MMLKNIYNQVLQEEEKIREAFIQCKEKKSLNQIEESIKKTKKLIERTDRFINILEHKENKITYHPEDLEAFRSLLFILIELKNEMIYFQANYQWCTVRWILNKNTLLTPTHMR